MRDSRARSKVVAILPRTILVGMFVTPTLRFAIGRAPRRAIARALPTTGLRQPRRFLECAWSARRSRTEPGGEQRRCASGGTDRERLLDRRFVRNATA